MATHCSIFAWRILWTEDPGRLQPMGLQRVRHNEWQSSSRMLRTTIYDYLKTIFSHLEITLSQEHNWMGPLIWTVMPCRVSISHFYFPIFLDGRLNLLHLGRGKKVHFQGSYVFIPDYFRIRLGNRKKDLIHRGLGLSFRNSTAWHESGRRICVD